MNILFIHQNFPGQFRHLAGYLADNPQNRITAICQPQAPGHPKVLRKLVYQPARKPSAATHHYLRSMEGAVLNGQAVAKVLLQMKKRGYVPDIVIAHPGWGEALYVKDIFPDTPLLSHFEFYYHADGADVNFDPEFPLALDDRLRIRTRNALHLLNLEACDAGISPTQWQKSLHPAQFHSKISVIHEGIDTTLVAPNFGQTFTLPNGTMLTRQQEVITYVARNLEPYRGFHIFMRAAQEICRRWPNVQIVIVGGDEVSYGRRLPEGLTYWQQMLREVSIDPSHVHFLGRISYADYLALLQISSAHVYLTVPFVLSWSVLEAMSAGCLVIGSDTAPVREVLRHGENGLLVDFFSPQQIADAVDETLSHPDRMQSLRKAAQQTIIENYEVQQSLVAYLKIINSLTGDKLLAGMNGNAARIRTPAESGMPATRGYQPVDPDIKVNAAPRSADMGLSRRELEILHLLAQGKCDKAIAANLHISVKTVSHHVSNIILKLGATNRTHAVARAAGLYELK